MNDTPNIANIEPSNVNIEPSIVNIEPLNVKYEPSNVNIEPSKTHLEISNTNHEISMDPILNHQSLNAENDFSDLMDFENIFNRPINNDQLSKAIDELCFALKKMDQMFNP